ncbi:hypothetical protein AcV7_010005 [Taiwanofungus camphoratus]|nr:hypothetical protein AcV7_010005 [Antrodia cinnamomea]
MSGLPPTLSTETGTPASEWAQSTTTAAFARPDPAPAASSPSVPPGVQATQSTQSTSTTPGHEFPGAYPSSSRSGEEYDRPGLGDSAKSAVLGVTSTAAQYIPGAKGVVGAVSSYMPGSGNGATHGSTTDGTARASEHDNAHMTSMPSSETTGRTPDEHVGGTGALPGTVSETGVAMPPAERTQLEGSAGSEDASAIGTYPSAPYPSVAEAPSSQIPAPSEDITLPPSAQPGAPRYPATSLSPSGSASAAAKAPSSQIPAPPHPSAARDTTLPPTTPPVLIAAHRDGNTTLPSQEPAGAAPFEHQDGVGALPGAAREAGVAALPDETGGGAGATGATAAQVGTHPRVYESAPRVQRPGEEEGNEHHTGREAAGGVGSLVGGRGEEGVALLPDERGGAQGDIKEDEATGTKTGAVKAKAEHVKEGAKDTARKAVGKEHKDDGYDTNYHPAQLHPAPVPSAPPASASPDAATTSDARPGVGGEGGEKAKKAGFLEKMRGEAKILLGRVEGKRGHEKVEEGKRVKAGEA